jgi:pteridine reductase
MSVDQPVALITGGARRVGRAIAETLSAAGYAVVITYRKSAAEAEALTRSIGARAIHADFFEPAAAIERIEREIGPRLDVLVNNASLYEPGELGKLQQAQIRQMMAIHVEAPLLLTQAMESRLRAARGSVVNMVDAMVERPWPRYMAYCASKAGLWNLTMSLARALAPEVTVNGIAPGVVEWPPDMPQTERDAYLKRVPLSRPGTPEDAARLVKFLVTDGKYMTGQIIKLDGGRSLS